MIQITAQRLRELTIAEKKLNALEGGGVDNWDGFSDSMRDIYYEIEIEEAAANFLTEIEVELLSSVDEPAGRGAGYCSRDSAREGAHTLLMKFIEDLLAKERLRKERLRQ